MSRIVSKIKKVPIGFKAAVVYTLASVFSKGLAIITMPIFTRIMSTDEVGMVDLYNSWHSMLNVVVTLSLTSGGYITALKEFEKERDKYQSSVLSLTSLVALFVAILYMIFPQFWNDLTGLPTELMVLMLIGFFVAPAYDFWLARQRYEYKFKLAGCLTAITALLSTTFAVIVVLQMNSRGASGVVIGRLYASNCMSYIIYGILWIYTIFRGKTFYNRNYWKFSLQLSIPLIGYALAFQVLNVSDRMMISRMVNNGAVGIYSTLYTVSSISLLVWSAINASFVPYLYQNIESEKTGIKKYSLLLIGTYAIVAVLLTFLAPEVVRILATDEYYEAIYIMPPIAAGVFLTCVSNMYSNILIYYKKTHYIMCAAIIAALVNVILNYFCISKFGYVAAAYTTLIAYIILAFGQAICAKMVCRRLRGSNSEIYNDGAVGLIAFFAIALSLSGLIWYQHTVLRYCMIVVGCAVGAILAGRTWKKRKGV
jgi:O-antigen/teichoic acid export membrane protein